MLVAIVAALSCRTADAAAMSTAPTELFAAAGFGEVTIFAPPGALTEVGGSCVRRSKEPT